MRKAASVLLMVGAGVLGGFLFSWAQSMVHNPGSSYFSDVSLSSPHNEDIGYLVEYGVTTGTSATTYSPSMAVTRDQMASFLMRQTAMDTSMTWAIVDNMYHNGYYFGLQAYQEGRLSYDDYQAIQAEIEWFGQMLTYEGGRMGSPRPDMYSPQALLVAHEALAAQRRERSSER